MPRLNEFRLYGADAPAAQVGLDLERHPTPFAVVRRVRDGEVHWYTFEVDEELIRRLKRGASDAATALDLHALDGSRFRVFQPARVADLFAGQAKAARALEPYPSYAFDAPLEGVTRSSPDGGLSVEGARAPEVLVDPFGIPRAVETAAPAFEGTIYARLATRDGFELAPDQIAEYTIELNAVAPDGVAAALALRFPAGRDRVDLWAEVSSGELAPPAGEAWMKSFSIDRDFRATPSHWSFRARAIGDRPRYAFTVTFHALGVVVGRIAFAALRRRAVTGMEAPRAGDAVIGLPADAGAKVLISLTRQARDGQVIRVYEEGALALPEAALEVDAGIFFQRLQQARGAEEIDEIAWGLRAELPDSVGGFLDAGGRAGTSTLIVSGGRVAPFELLQLRPAQDGPMLGVERPVARWELDCAMPAAQGGVARRCAAIRSLDWPSLEAQEQALAAHFEEVIPVRSKAELAQVLERSDVDVLHFMGHANDNPAQIVVGDEAVTPGAFRPSRPLLSERHPLFFINGCRGAAGGGRVPAVYGNPARALLKSGFGAVVGATIEIEAAASRAAAETFYAALAEGETVVEATRRVRARAFAAETPAEHRASFLGFVAFAPCGLKMTVRRRP
jgi:hypothetical protein